MTIATFPTIVPNACDWGLQSNTQNSRSELDGTVQTLALPGDIWTGTLTFTDKIGSEARVLRAFLASLRGQAGRFWMSPPGYKKAGTAPGTPLVKGAGWTGSTLIADGWGIGMTGVLLAGDYFQIGNELKMMTADALITDGTGSTYLEFTPPIRISPADNAAIITTKPSCVMMLKDPNQARWQASPTPIYAMSIACEEALS